MPTSAVKSVNVMLGLSSLGLFLIGVGVLSSLILSRQDWNNIQMMDDGSGDVGTGEQAVSSTEKTIMVDIEGEVLSPGVYEVSSNARISDALSAAGGLSARADRNRISREMNLAQPLADGTKVYIPAIGEQPEVAGSFSQVSINNSTLNQLDALWGIGEARAQSIIDGRPYQHVEELVEKKILPQNVYEKNKGKLTL